MTDLGYWVQNYSESQKNFSSCVLLVTNLPNTDESMKISESQVIPLYTSSVIALHQMKN